MMKFWKFGQDDHFDNRPDKLRDALFEAVAEENHPLFVKLCKNNRTLIFDHFQAWQKVPETVRKSPAQIRWYGQGIRAVANYFAQRGEPGLLQRLTGLTDTNPMNRWRLDLTKAQALLAAQREDEAVRILEKLAQEVEHHQGSAVDEYAPKISGLLGLGYLQQGQYEKALKATQQAYLACQNQEDVEGIITYCGNLEEINRQLGDLTETEHWRAEQEKLLAQTPQAAPNSEQADESEIIFRDNQGRTLRREDLNGFTGQVQWEINGKENIPRQARILHQAGREAGQQGDYDQALRLFSQAAGLAPTWPRPVYDAAFTYLLKNDFDNALASYEKVDELAPRGFFTSKTALHTLRQEKDGKLPPGIYSLYLSFEKIEPKQKMQIVEQLLEKCPNFGPAWQEKAGLTDDAAECLQIIAKGLACNPDPDTKGMLLINKATLLNREGQKQEALEILSNLALDPNETLQNEHLAKAFLSDLV